jgi:hypothetical protein
MNQVTEALGKLNEGIKSTLAKIEEWSFFERIMIFYEGMEPTRQALVRGGIRLGFSFFALWICISPVLHSYSTKSFIRTFNDSTFQLQTLAAVGSDVVAQAPKPPSWQALPASSAAELENSMREFLASIGVPDDFFTAKADGADRFQLDIEELTLRQALAITFQMDGWYPAVRTESLEINVHPKHVDRLNLKLAAFIPAALPGGGESFGSHDSEFEGSLHEGGTAGGGDSHFGGGNPPDGGDVDYFDGNNPPVPPPPAEFNEGGPPPPANPPNFDDNFDDNPPVYEEGGDL